MVITKFNLLFSSVLWSVVLMAYFFIISSSDESAKLWAKYSAHLSFIYLFVAYSVGTLTKYFAFKPINHLAINRRSIGLSFSITHSFHLIAIVYFFTTTAEQPSIVSIIGGGLGYLLMYAMTLTSTDAMVERMGVQRWKMLHTIGINYLIIIFFITFVGSIFEISAYSINSIYVLAILFIWILKIKKLINR